MKTSLLKGFFIAFAVYSVFFLLFFLAVDHLWPGSEAHVTFGAALWEHVPYAVALAFIVAGFATIRRRILTK